MPLAVEVGEVIHAWVLLRHFMAARSKEMTDDIQQNMANHNLWFLNSVIERLENDAIARLSEIGGTEAGKKLTFAHAHKRLKRIGLQPAENELERFQRFIRSNRLIEKRNAEISHKAYVEDWSRERAPIHLPYRSLIRAIALAVRTMQSIDRAVFGVLHTSFFWKALRQRRYTATLPARIGYMIAQDIRLPESVRAGIIIEEIREGTFRQELIDTVANGVPVQVYASKKWGAVNLGGRLLVLPQYPLQSRGSIEGEQIVVDPTWLTARNSGPPSIDEVETASLDRQ